MAALGRGFFFFFQAEDGIRDKLVTGVQTCALPISESQVLATLYRTITPERLWRGKFTKPVGRPASGTGFGARRIINGQSRSPHGGIDYSVPRGTPVVAAHAGRGALVAEFFFQGRLVILDHGLR